MAKKVKTIRGLLGKLEQISQQDFDQLNGYEKMNGEQKQLLSFLMGEINNFISEIQDFKIK